jgi:sugar phosphate isomerase/epimerase
MKVSFSTLACPDWTLAQAVKLAASSGYDGLELRFLEGEDSLWKLAAFQGAGLTQSKRMLDGDALAVSCVGTSCRFHSPDAAERQHWVEEGKRMAELAAALGSPAIRIFGDKIQAGDDRESTRGWIADGIRRLVKEVEPHGVAVWLETHGDFASSAETLQTLRVAGHDDVGVVWDPANAFTEGKEDPVPAARKFGNKLRHVHLRDLDCHGGEWSPALTGEGKFPLPAIVSELRRLNYGGFVSFEWEKKWRPELAEADVAVPQFAEWFRQQ